MRMARVAGIVVVGARITYAKTLEKIKRKKYAETGKMQLRDAPILLVPESLTPRALNIVDVPVKLRCIIVP